MSFVAKLRAASQANNSLVCVGLDPSPTRTPLERIAAFNRAIIEATHDLVCAYKPNIAFYEAWGAPGLEALRETLAAIPSHIPVICDAKRNDIGNTAEAYAQALFETFGFDAATVNPYLGQDSLEPFLSYADKGVIVLCRTSNPGAADIQDLAVATESGLRPLFEVVAEKAKAWNSRGDVGLVVGATYPEELRRIRQLCPEMPILIPGVGAQGGDLELAVRYGVDATGGGAIINSARGIIYASTGADFAIAARAAAEEMRDAINRCRA